MTAQLDALPSDEGAFIAQQMAIADPDEIPPRRVRAAAPPDLAGRWTMIPQLRAPVRLRRAKRRIACS